MPTLENLKKRLHERALRLAAAAEDRAEAANALEVVEFSSGTVHYGIETRYVREVKVLQDSSWVPGVPPYVLGLVNAGGEILTLLDIRHFLGLTGQPSGGPGKMVILHAQGRAFAVRAEEIIGVHPAVLQENLASLPSLDARQTKYVLGMTAASLIVLDGNALLHAPEMRIG